MDLRRKQNIVASSPVDNAGRLTAVPGAEFELSRMIFEPLPKGLKQFHQRTKYPSWMPYPMKS